MAEKGVVRKGYTWASREGQGEEEGEGKGGNSPAS